jgi:hypothetical protein
MKSYLTDRRIIIFIKNDFQIQYEYKYIYFFNSFSQIHQEHQFYEDKYFSYWNKLEKEKKENDAIFLVKVNSQ